jgi:hypothetical protein
MDMDTKAGKRAYYRDKLTEAEVVAIRKEIATEVMFNFSKSMWLQYVKPILAREQNDSLATLEEMLDKLAEMIVNEKEDCP